VNERVLVGASRLFAVVFVGLGVAILARTAYEGGGQVGILAGLVFLALGVLRWRAVGGRQPPAG
jgi:hypothetical protein